MINDNFIRCSLIIMLMSACAAKPLYVPNLWVATDNKQDGMPCFTTGIRNEEICLSKYGEKLLSTEPLTITVEYHKYENAMFTAIESVTLDNWRIGYEPLNKTVSLKGETSDFHVNLVYINEKQFDGSREWIPKGVSCDYKKPGIYCRVKPFKINYN